MSIKSKVNLKQLSMGLILSVVSATLFAMSPGVEKTASRADSAVGGGAYYWYDGSKKLPLTMNTGVVAEVATVTSSVVQANDAAAREIKYGTGGMRFWDVSNSGGANKTLSSLKTGSLSPVFHDGVSMDGSRRALPGGIIVTFKDDWDAQRVQEWVSAQGLNIQNKLNFGNIYVIATDVGISALTLANQIHESGQVVAAQPNWWREYRHQ